MPKPILASSQLANVRYEIRGPLARKAAELERAGRSIIKLNIGNPGNFGFRAPEALRQAIVDHIGQADPYGPQKGILAAREAIVAQQRARGIDDVGTEDVWIGNGVSELIMMALRGLLCPGDEVLIPSPDYPLWTAATVLAGGQAVHYPCPEAQGFQPDVEAMAKLITPRTRAIVVINPNNPTGAVYSRATLQAIAHLAVQHGLVVFSDEIYDQILYDGAPFTPMAELCRGTLCGTFGGLSKVYRACGWRVGWLAFSGPKDHAQDYLVALDLLAGLRLCPNMLAQAAVVPALADTSIRALVAPGGRLYETRRAIIEGVRRSAFLDAVVPQGAIYAFLRVKTERLPGFKDSRFALDLLERRDVLITPGHGFNVPYHDHFRITLLPDEQQVADVFARIESLLEEQAAHAGTAGQAR